METPVIADILRFVMLRAPQNIEHEKDLVHFIRDYRIQDSYNPVESHDVTQDDNRFLNSPVAQFTFNLVKNKLLQGISSNQEVLAGNREIADDVKFRIPPKERTPIWIDEFVDVIRNHMANFDKRRLRDELDAVVRKNFPSYTGITDYVEKIAQAKGDEEPLEAGASQFCLDFDQLFDQLYVLYVCKRKYPLNLEYVLDGLRTLHIIRFLNIESNRFEREERRLRGCLLVLLAWLRRRNSGGSLSSGPPKDQTDGSRTQCAEIKLTNNGRFPIPQVRLESKEDLADLFGATPAIHKMFAYLIGYYKPFNDIRPIGIGDLLVVRQFLRKYEAGEISHIENVLKGESKDRSYRRLDRSEDTYTTEAEATEETQKELQTTSRYELQTEVASTIQSDLSLQLNTSMSATYGMVSFSGSAGMSYSQSKNDSQRTASNFSKDIIDRSLSKIQKRVREERISKKIYEIEEIDKHGFNNVQGSGNIAGIYRWLDKHYIAQVYNYGKRLMFEFVIPEPAAFMKEVVERNKQSKPDEPQKPTPPELTPGVKITPGSITQDIVYTYANLYEIDLSGLEKRLPESAAIEIPCDFNPQGNATKQFTNTIPDGYAASSATVTGYGMGLPNLSLAISIAGTTQSFTKNKDVPPVFPATEPTHYVDFNYTPYENTTYDNLPPIEKTMTVGVFCAGMNQCTLSVSVKIKLLASAEEAWQNKAFGLIMNGYTKKLAEYNSQMAEYQPKLDSYNQSQEGLVQGYNPKINDDIIKLELKKHCLTMITKQFASDKYKAEDINFDSMRSKNTGFDKNGIPITLELPGIDMDGKPIDIPASIPAIDIDDAREKGTIIQFLEQAFEWPQISYLLYPYFWGHRPGWWFEAQKYYNESDPLFAKFLQAGAVRVLVAVHPAYETAVMHYLYTQEPWNGGEAPTLNDPLYIPIYVELRNQQDDLNGAEPYGDPWDVVVPTSLIYLQSSDELPSFESPTS